MMIFCMIAGMAIITLTNKSIFISKIEKITSVLFVGLGFLLVITPVVIFIIERFK